MPFTEPLAPLPTAWPNPRSPLVNDDKSAAPQLHTLLQQIREYLTKADAALQQLEP
jgi:hypothetical protein